MNKDHIAQTAAFIKTASETTARLEQERDAALEKVATLEAQVEQQKTASEVQTSVISTERAADAVSKIIQAGFLKEASRDRAVAALSADPHAGLDFIEKLANDTIAKRTLPSLGKGVHEKKASVNTDLKASDDAWARHFGGKRSN